MFKFMSHESQHECAGPRSYVKTRRVDECRTLEDIFLHCLPAFGGAYLRSIYQILDRAIGMGCPLTLAVSGPVTVSGQHHTWLIPLLETGWVAYLSTTDAVCYHDGHRSLDAYNPAPYTKSPLTATTPRCATRAPSASPIWRSTKASCWTRIAFSPPFSPARNSSVR